MPLTDVTRSRRAVGLDETRIDQLHAELEARIAAWELRQARQAHERLAALERRRDDRLAQLETRIGWLERRITEHLISGLGLWAVTTTAIGFGLVILLVTEG